MEKIKVMTIFGTRPEATKMAPLIKEMYTRKEIEQVICVTAQHRQMLDQVLEVFGIKPHYDLNIMSDRQTLTDITTKALIGLEEVMKKEKPDLVLVHGDTTTTFAGSLAAFYSQTKLGHVEAGLRTYNKLEPYPEEMNRKLTGALADLHFSPTQPAKENLLKENVPESSIYVTGNTAVDCLKTTVEEDYTFSVDLLNKIDYKANRVIAMTAHRRENLGLPLENICRAVRRIADENEDVTVVYAVHFNPAVQEVAGRILGGHERIFLTDPIDMKDMHNLMNLSYLILTDSGGLQEEAPGMDKPVLVLRNVTERPEGIKAGTLKLAGVEEDEIVRITTLLLNDRDVYNKMASARNPFGDGEASARITDAILYHFGFTDKRPEDF